MAFLAIQVPQDTARIFQDIDVPGDKGKVGKHHITLCYLGKDVPIAMLTKAIEATFKVVSSTRPFTVSVSKVTTFPVGDDGVPVICPIDSEELHALRARLVDRFVEDGVEYNNKYPIYKPHVTLSYAEEAIPDRQIPTLTWGAHEVILWGGDSGDSRLVVQFPMSLSLREKVARRFLEG